MGQLRSMPDHPLIESGTVVSIEGGVRYECGGLTIPCIEVCTHRSAGNTKATTQMNWHAIAMALNRPPSHLVAFVCLATGVSVILGTNNEDSAQLVGDHSPVELQTHVFDFIERYVLDGSSPRTVIAAVTTRVGGKELRISGPDGQFNLSARKLGKEYEGMLTVIDRDPMDGAHQLASEYQQHCLRFPAPDKTPTNPLCLPAARIGTEPSSEPPVAEPVQETADVEPLASLSTAELQQNSVATYSVLDSTSVATDSVLDSGSILEFDRRSRQLDLALKQMEQICGPQPHQSPQNYFGPLHGSPIHSAAMPQLQTTTRTASVLDPKEKEAFQQMAQRLQDELSMMERPSARTNSPSRQQPILQGPLMQENQHHRQPQTSKAPPLMMQRNSPLRHLNCPTSQSSPATSYTNSPRVQPSYLNPPRAPPLW